MTDIYNYTNKLFLYSKNELIDKEFSMIGLCVSHAMIKFNKNLKGKFNFLNCEQIKFIMCIFALLANFLDLSAFDAIIKFSFTIFLSSHKSENDIHQLLN